MALASRGSIRVTVALWPAGYEMPRMKSVKKAQIPPPPPSPHPPERLPKLQS
jgi:hypothetical protein